MKNVLDEESKRLEKLTLEDSYLQENIILLMENYQQNQQLAER